MKGHLPLALLLVACRGVPAAPPCSYVTAEGTTLAHSDADAEQYGRLAEHLSRRTRAVLRVREFEPFELRRLDHEVPGTAQAGTLRWYDADGLVARYIRLATERRDAALFLIAHELVHQHVEETWGLPLVLEEGLAEQVAASLVEGGDEVLAEHRALYAASLDAPILRADRPLRITRADWRDLSHEEKRQLYAWGYVHAEELGVDRLRTHRASLAPPRR